MDNVFKKFEEKNRYTLKNIIVRASIINSIFFLHFLYGVLIYYFSSVVQNGTGEFENGWQILYALTVHIFVVLMLAVSLIEVRLIDEEKKPILRALGQVSYYYKIFFVAIFFFFFGLFYDKTIQILLVVLGLGIQLCIYIVGYFLNKNKLNLVLIDYLMRYDLSKKHNVFENINRNQKTIVLFYLSLLITIIATIFSNNSLIIDEYIGLVALLCSCVLFVIVYFVSFRYHRCLSLINIISLFCSIVALIVGYFLSNSVASILSFIVFVMFMTPAINTQVKILRSLFNQSSK